VHIAIIAIIMIATASIGGYGVKLHANNQQLRADVEAATRANQTYIHAMHAMAQEQVKLNQQVIERDASQRQIQRNLAQTQRRLRDASHSSAMSDTDRKCLDLAIPGPVLDVLRQPAADGNDNSRPGQGMPGGRTLLGHTHAAVSRQHLGRAGELCRRAAGRCDGLALRPRSSEGIL
jgi:hypothetical protein